MNPQKHCSDPDIAEIELHPLRSPQAHYCIKLFILHKDVFRGINILYEVLSSEAYFAVHILFQIFLKQLILLSLFQKLVLGGG